jgi:hypothetical protein
MGFCVYWVPTETNAETLRRFAADLRLVVQFSTVREENGWVALDDYEERCETFAVSTKPDRYNGCKTSRLPFTEDVMATCILMVHHKMATDYSNDDEEEFPWEPVFERVASVLGWGPVSSFQEMEIARLKKRVEELEEQLSSARLLMGRLMAVLGGAAC